MPEWGGAVAGGRRCCAVAFVEDLVAFGLAQPRGAFRLVECDQPRGEPDEPDGAGDEEAGAPAQPGHYGGHQYGADGGTGGSAGAEDGVRDAAFRCRKPLTDDAVAGGPTG